MRTCAAGRVRQGPSERLDAPGGAPGTAHVVCAASTTGFRALLNRTRGGRSDHVVELLLALEHPCDVHDGQQLDLPAPAFALRVRCWSMAVWPIAVDAADTGNRLDAANPVNAPGPFHGSTLPVDAAQWCRILS